MNKIIVIGAGLAGSEAALTIADSGYKVDLYDMKPHKKSPAHNSDGFAELVCSNSLKGKRISSAAGLLKKEMQMLGSACIQAAYACEVPAGGALAVDRDAFSDIITKRILAHENIEVICKELVEIPKNATAIIATGPLTSDAFAAELERICGDFLSFYDAAAPIVAFDSIDMTKAFWASRYEYDDAAESIGDYINCPMNKDEYEVFYRELITAEQAPLNSFDASPDSKKNVYEGCIPVEILAKRGIDSVRYGAMKPVGLKDPRTGHRPWAVVQLRAENKGKTMFGLVGFQTSLKFGEQKRVFSKIPGLENSEFFRYGVMHRNTFINSPKLLNSNYSLKTDKNIFFAGQITGVEGYMESAMSGILAGKNAVQFLENEPPIVLPKETMMGALTRVVTTETTDFQPMGANFGIIPPLDTVIKNKQLRNESLAQRALELFAEYCDINDVKYSL